MQVSHTRAKRRSFVTPPSQANRLQVCWEVRHPRSIDDGRAETMGGRSLCRLLPCCLRALGCGPERGGNDGRALRASLGRTLPFARSRRATASPPRLGSLLVYHPGFLSRKNRKSLQGPFMAAWRLFVRVRASSRGVPAPLLRTACPCRAGVVWSHQAQKRAFEPGKGAGA